MLRQLRALLCCIAIIPIIVACSDGSDSGPDGLQLRSCADTQSCAANPPLVLGGERPAMVAIPADYDVNTRYPMIMVLHGRGVDGNIQSLYFDFFERVDSRDFVMLYPDGRVSGDGRRQWRSAPTCCDTPIEEAQEVSDVPYLSALIEEAAATYSIDTARIGLIGHSSGGFMTLTMACEASHLFTAAINLAGSTFSNPELCLPAEKRVSLLNVHGDMDDTVFFEGIEGVYLSAPAVAQRFAMLNGCDVDNPISGPDIDLVGGALEGAETSSTYWPGCLDGTEVEFWRINAGPHIPVPWVESGLDTWIDWLLDRGRSQ